MSADDRQRRWESEAGFFDQWAERAAEGVQRTDAAVLDRYRRPGTLYHLEYRIRLLGDLTDRHVLDVGCGNGVNAALLAELGARVTGIDVSPKAIEVAQQRAAVSGLTDRCHFVCSPLETADDVGLGAPFDVIWGDAILHHLLPELDSVLARLASWTRPGGVMVFSEPVNLAPWLRKLRLWVPVHTEATPDERPLEQAEIELIRTYLPDMRMQPFHLLSRLNRFVLPNCNYERASPTRRTTANALAAFDAAAFRLPIFRPLAGYAVIWGHPGVPNAAAGS